MACKCGVNALEAINETLRTKQLVEIKPLECKHNNQLPILRHISTFPLIDSSNIFYGSGLTIWDETYQYYYNMVSKSSKISNYLLP